MATLVVCNGLVQRIKTPRSGLFRKINDEGVESRERMAAGEGEASKGETPWKVHCLLTVRKAVGD